MDREARTELLTWITTVFTVLGVVLAAFVAFPSLLAGFMQLHSSERPILGLIILLLAASAFWARRNLNIPDLTRLEVIKVLTILDKDGKRALSVRTQKERANRSLSTRSFVISNLKSDGSMEDLKIDDEDVKETEKEIILGACRVTRTWQGFLKKGQVIDTKFSCTVLDSYSKDVEKEILVIPVFTGRVHLEINLPSSRRVITTKAYLGYGDQPHAPLPEPIISDERKKITLAIRNPKLGGQYFLEWKW